MNIAIEIWALAYLGVSVLLQAFWRLMNREKGFAASSSLFLLTLLCTVGGYFFHIKGSYIDLSFDPLRLVGLSFVVIINTLQLLWQSFAPKEQQTLPLHYILLNIFGTLAICATDPIMAIVGIIALKLVALIHFTTVKRVAKKGIIPLIHEFLRLNVITLILFIASIAFLLLKDENWKTIIDFQYVGMVAVFAALMVEGGLFTFRVGKRIEMASLERGIGFLKFSSINFSVLFSFLLILNQSIDESLHLVIVGALLITLLMQWIGVSQLRKPVELTTRMYLANLSFVALIFNVCKNQHGLMTALVYMIGLHLLIPAFARMIDRKCGDEKFSRFESVLLFLYVGWLTILPVPSSLFTRLALMNLNANFLNICFYVVYLFTLAIIAFSLIQLGKNAHQEFRPVIGKGIAKYLWSDLMLLIFVVIAGMTVGMAA